MGNRHRAATNAAQCLYLGQTLLFFVNANRDELDHRLGNAQAALQFQHHRAIGFDGHQDIVAVIELAHGVSKLAPAHLLDRLDHTATIGDRGGKAGD